MLVGSRPPAAQRCQHIFDNGRQCASPALRGLERCYWHQRAHRVNTQQEIVTPILEDPNSIQIAFTQVYRLLMTGKVTAQVANSAFYGLSLAMRNETNLKGYWDSSCSTRVSPLMRPAIDDHEPVVSPKEVILSESEGSLHSAATTTEPSSTTEPCAECPPTDTAVPDLEQVILSASEGSMHSARTTTEPCSTDIPARDRPPEDFLTTPLPTTSTFQLREQRFPPEAIRAYWTQHLPPEVANLTHNNQLLYNPPTWLPLTPEEAAYLSDHRDSRTNYERLILHCSRPNIFPPQPEQILKCHADLENSGSLQGALLTQLARHDSDSIEEKKKPRSA